MAAFGKVLDLLDDRYLNLQDVAGNVEPLPTLVPYDEYTQNVLVYRMDTNHEIFMGLIQDYTMRHAQETGKEVWTWYAQWEVESRYPSQAPTPKKPRLDTSKPGTPSDPHPRRQAHATTVFERRILDPDLVKEEDMLRILIDIVQTDSSLVPNFIEFLYRWIDFYEGDGKALKAALKWEIPSLWDFECHPLVLPDKQKQSTKEKTQNERLTNNKEAEELAQSSPTKKMREKPDLAAMERKVEESERLQYREVRYGIRPPKLEQPIPPLINIPKDTRKRQKYYAACFKSRQRALVLLLEAGITSRQIANYKKLQSEHPRETPHDEGGDGMRHYNKDAKYAQCEFELKERQMLLRAKQTEISISSKLALEASLASRNAVAEGTSGIPLIPPTPTYDRRPDMAAAMLKRISAIRAASEERIRLVPAPLVGRLKSKLFEGAKAMAPSTRLSGWNPSDGIQTTDSSLGDESGMEDSEDEDTDMDGEDNGGDGSENEDGNSLNPNQWQSSPSTTSMPLPKYSQLSTHQTSLSGIPPLVTASNHSLAFQQDQTPAQTTAFIAGSSSSQSAAVPANIAEYIRNLTSEQAQSLLPLLNQGARQALANVTRFEASGGQVPMSGNNRLANLHSQVASPVQLSSFMPPVQPIRAGQSGRAAIPLLSAPASHLPSIMITPHISNNHPPSFNGGFASQTSFTPPLAHPLPLPIQPVYQGTFQDSTNTTYMSRGFQHLAPQPSLPTLQLPNSLRPELYQSFQSSAPSNVQTLPTMNIQLGSRQNVIAQPLNTGSSTPQSPVTRITFDVEEFLSLRRQQTASGQVEISYPYSDLPMSIQMPPGPMQAPTSGNLQPRPPSVAGPPRLQPLMIQPPQSSHLHLPSSSPQYLSFFPPRTGIQRNAPSPLILMPPPPSPLSSLAPSILATSPFAASPYGIPIQVYLPKIVVPRGKESHSRAALSIESTDALLLGHTHPGSGKIILSKAIFLPTSVWTNTLRRVRVGAYTVLETYVRPKLSFPSCFNPSTYPASPHHAIYTKLTHAYSLISSSSDRENDVTKRWRCTRGPMTMQDRGAVWEGWAAVLERGIEMTAEERRGAVVSLGIINGGMDRKGGDNGEDDRRRREVDELIDLSDDSDDDDGDDMGSGHVRRKNE